MLASEPACRPKFENIGVNMLVSDHACECEPAFE